MSANGRRKRTRRECREQVGPARMLVLVCRIGHAPRVPPGTVTGDCFRCGHAVWITPVVARLARRVGLGMAPLCDVCLAALGDD